MPPVPAGQAFVRDIHCHEESSAIVRAILALAAAEASIALSITIAVYRNYRSINSKELSELNG